MFVVHSMLEGASTNSSGITAISPRQKNIFRLFCCDACRSTSGYPDTLRCLEDVACDENSNLHASLVAECRFNRCQEEFACQGEKLRLSRARARVCRGIR